AAGTTRDTVRRMADRGLVALDPAPQPLADDRRVTLTPEQEMAVAACVETLDGGGGDVLVHGVTGSGKTEVYLRVIDAALARGVGQARGGPALRRPRGGGEGGEAREGRGDLRDGHAPGRVVGRDPSPRQPAEPRRRAAAGRRDRRSARRRRLPADPPADRCS